MTNAEETRKMTMADRAKLADAVAKNFRDALARIRDAEDLLRAAATGMECDGQESYEVRRVEDLRTSIHMLASAHLLQFAGSWEGYAAARKERP